VTDITLQLAKLMNMEDKEMTKIKVGALLHDIGKISISDSILNKPGPLSEEEWKIMRKHPEYAFQILSKTKYLRDALDIPYCHHEKWDGSGYPRGLKGEAIPKAARVFAVVDVWDTLISNRLYRPAWSQEKALEYIQEQSGSHFDPQVVNVFVNNLKSLNLN
jgi:HD-GYP domain-containing protein (c-di-GMP phosphodiesterase class II)